MIESQLPTQEEMLALIQRELRLCAPALREAFAPQFTDLWLKNLKWEYGDNEQFPAWVFADLRERNVHAAYCVGGHGALGSPWGYIFKHDDGFGMDCGWFRSLQELLIDWGLGSNA